MADVQLQPTPLDSLYIPSSNVSSGSFPQVTFPQLQQRTKSGRLGAAVRKPPVSDWTPACHSRVDTIVSQVDQYFLEHWDFPDEKARKTFIKAGFSRVTCLYFPLALDDRIHFACRLLTVLFLVDDVLEGLSLDEGEAYNARLIPISRGELMPDSNYLLVSLNVTESVRRSGPRRIHHLRLVGEHARSR